MLYKHGRPQLFFKGGGGVRIGQGGCHLTAVNTLSDFGRFNERGGGCCPLSADSISEVSNPIIQSVGEGWCPLSVRMYANFYYKGGGGEGGPWPPLPGDAHDKDGSLLKTSLKKSRLDVYNCVLCYPRTLRPSVELSGGTLCTSAKCPGGTFRTGVQSTLPHRNPRNAQMKQSASYV